MPKQAILGLGAFFASQGAFMAEKRGFSVAA